MLGLLFRILRIGGGQRGARSQQQGESEDGELVNEAWILPISRVGVGGELVSAEDKRTLSSQPGDEKQRRGGEQQQPPPHAMRRFRKFMQRCGSFWGSACSSFGCLLATGQIPDLPGYAM